MNRFFNGIGDFFEQFVFPFAEAVGGPTNFFWVVFGFVGLVGWMVWEVKNRTEPTEE
jgi:hypothetical protein